jgi:hypothetical protein
MIAYIIFIRKEKLSLDKPSISNLINSQIISKESSKNLLCSKTKNPFLQEKRVIVITGY